MSIYTPIFAEVADKMPTFGEFWAVACFGTVLILPLLFFRRVWLLVVGCIVALAVGVISVGTLYEPITGPAVRQEVGPSYAVHAWASGITPLVLLILFWFIVRRPCFAGGRVSGVSSSPPFGRRLPD